MQDARKYIVIPEYKALYAMRKCFGPTRGPLVKPCPTPIDIIGELLEQVETLTIFEVKMLENDKFSDPVQLTLDNYKLPYDEIVGGVKAVEEVAEIQVVEPVKVEPVVVVEEPAVEITEEVVTAEVEDVVAENVSDDEDEKVTGAAEEVVEVEEVSEEVPADTQAHMTKAQRRAANRKAAEDNK